LQYNYTDFILYLLWLVGELIGDLRSLRLTIQRSRIRDSIHTSDPINTDLQWFDPINRRPYSVRSPNSLWHMDANLKLVLWGFVIHGAIDGYSRLMVFCKVSDNNKAETVLQYFKAAEKINGKCSRLRCDYGGENMHVAQYMLEDRGINRSSVLTGSSIRNQRIERIWRDCSRSVIKLFSRVFGYLEERDKTLDYTDAVCRVCLHYVFIPRIQQLIDEWVLAWNNHPISGCGNLSPLQLREAGFLHNYGSTSSFVRDVFDGPLHSDITPDEYGVEIDDTNANEDEQEDTAVSVIPPADAQLHQSLCDRLLSRLSCINPLENDGNFGMTTYHRCLEIAKS
jgi:hypothetical protein